MKKSSILILRLFVLTTLLLLPINNYGMNGSVSVLKDNYTDTVKVSGSMKVGAMFFPEDFKNREKSYNYPKVPNIFISYEDIEIGDKEICLELTSQDGKYHGLYAFKPDKETGLPSDGIKITSKYWKQIKEYLHSKIVVLASIEQDCGKKSKKVQYIPASWVQNYDKNRIVIFLNSLTLETSIELKFSDGQKKVFPCSHLSGVGASGYNFECLVVLQGDDFNGNPIDRNKINKIRILRTEPGENYRPKRFNLRIKGENGE